MAGGSSDKSLGLYEALSGPACGLQAEIERNKPLSLLSTLGVGGQAECYLEPACTGDFQTVCRQTA